MTDESSFEVTRRFEAAPQHCGRCGSTIEETWTFCGSCGQSITLPPPTSQLPSIAISDDGEPTDEAAHDPHAGPAEPRLNGPWGKRVVIAALVCLTVIAGIGWVQQIRTSNDLERRTRDLETTRSTLTATRADLSSTTDELKSTKTELAKRIKSLKQTTAELDRANGKLSGARDRLDLQAGQIATLRICLGGVQRALSDVAYGDFSSALSELEQVQTACRKANDSL